MDLTETQHAILGLIAERIEAEGMPPSQAEIARAFGFKGVRAAQYHLEALEAAGAIERIPGRARVVIPVEEATTSRFEGAILVEQHALMSDVLIDQQQALFVGRDDEAFVQLAQRTYVGRKRFRFNFTSELLR